MKINYHTANAALGATALYNGNISSLEWTTGASCLVNGVTRNRAGYGYAYDGNNRLTRAKYGEYTGGSWNTALNNYNTDTVTYDRNGNIKTMTNRGWTGSAFGLIDQLTYSYDANVPNRLMTMSEASSTTKGFKSLGGSGYTYDANGNVTVDSYKGITRTVYNYLNLPDTVFFGSKYLNFTYDAGGTKWRKKTVDGGTVTEKHYLAGIEYTGTTLEAIYHSEGRARSLGGGNYEYQYTIKDHLGNSRVMYKVVTGTATILQENHYYPFGMGLENTAFIDSTNKYRYNGKEMINDFGLDSYDYGARYYGVTIGRWGQVDPLAEKYPEKTIYNYTLNNPIQFIDPNGKEVIAPNQASKNLVMQSVAYMFGKNHGYSFNGNKLVHNGVVPNGMSSGQSVMFKYFNNVLVNSETKTEVHANKTSTVIGDGQLAIMNNKAAGTTFSVGNYSRNISIDPKFEFQINFSGENKILIPSNSVTNGTSVETIGGIKSVDGDHILSHEFGHAIVNTIMNEFGGEFGSVNFNNMSEEERSDWAIRFTNTLFKKGSNDQETGGGQHGRALSIIPTRPVDPLLR